MPRECQRSIEWTSTALVRQKVPVRTRPLALTGS